MVQSAHLRQFDHRTQFWKLNRALFRSVFAQRKMSTGTPVVPEIRLQGPPQRGLIEHDHMIQTLTPDRPDESLHVRRLPRRSRSGQDFSDAHLSDLVMEATGVNRIAIMQQIAWSTAPGKGLGDLACR